MGYAVYFDEKRNRDCGYGVPSTCDHPGCRRVIDRGLAYACGGEPFDNEFGCGLYFCEKHLHYDVQEDEEGKIRIRGKQVCMRCLMGEESFEMKPDRKEWINWKMTDWSWAEWRKENGFPEPKRMRKRKPDELGIEILATGTYKKSEVSNK